jgi:hypothetical protein
MTVVSSEVRRNTAAQNYGDLCDRCLASTSFRCRPGM